VAGLAAFDRRAQPEPRRTAHDRRQRRDVNGDYLNSIKAIADDIDLARDYVHTSTSSWSTTTPPSPSSTRSGGRASAG
jgi:hypothetical protein